MTVGIQYTGSVAASASRRLFTHDWSPALQVVWTVVPTSPNATGAQLEWDLSVERATATAVTYWVTVRNLTASPVDFEVRYAILS